MSKLYFTPVDQAFTLGSSQIKDTQEEIAQLTKLILESNGNPKGIKQKNQVNNNQITNVPQPMSSPNYMRVGYPDQQSPVFRPPTSGDDIDYNLMKVIGHPKFDDIVKNYALIHHPEWLLKETVYVPQNVSLPQNVPQQSKSNFGNQYQSTICSDVKRYIIFFVICTIIFLGLSLYL